MRVGENGKEEKGKDSHKKKDDRKKKAEEEKEEEEGGWNESQVLVHLHYGSFHFLSVPETFQTSGSIYWHTHKHGHAHGYLDEAQVSFNLIKSESEFYSGI